MDKQDLSAVVINAADHGPRPAGRPAAVLRAYVAHGARPAHAGSDVAIRVAQTARLRCSRH
jgi:hypothetical protein